MNTETIKLINDVISTVCCYNDGYYDQGGLIERLKGFNLPDEVIEHVEAITNCPEPAITPRCEGCPFINNCHNECYEDVFDPVTGEKL